MPAKLSQLALVVLLVATSCSSSASDSDRVAAEVVARISLAVRTNEVSAAEFGDGCVAEVLRDEYGFPVEVQRCADEPIASTGDPTPPTDSETWFGSGDALVVVTLVRELAITGDCSSAEFGQSQLLSLDSAVRLLERSPDGELVILARRLKRLRRGLDRLQSACILGRQAWLDAVDDVTMALAAVSEHVETLEAAA